MNVFDYLFYFPYKIIWHALNLFRKPREVVFYCEDALDFAMFQPIKKHLSFPITYVAYGNKAAGFFRRQTLPFKNYPVFPAAVIMARHAAFRFPVKQILKIGFDHGLYQFKRWTSAKYYNRFNVYLVSSPRQSQQAAERGITTTCAVGYPKLDKAFDGSFTLSYLQRLAAELGLNPEKKTIIFTSTWDVGGLSALDKWINKVGQLAEKYNVLLSVHTWTDPQKIAKLKALPKTFFLDRQDITDYLLLCDYFVGDYNSLIGEFCALDKPVITFRVPHSSRAVDEVRRLIADLSVQVDNFEEIEAAIAKYEKNPQFKKAQRRRANQTFYLALDGQAGKRAAQIIEETLTVQIK